jgi:di/tricarboxylate transporter
VHPDVKKSAPAKISAIGFIIVIVFGNLWLVNALMETATPFWVSYGFFSGVIFVMVGGIGLALLLLSGRVTGDKGGSDPEV